jgi:tRNA(Arg) A34 adenosine deaminase TadA
LFYELLFFISSSNKGFYFFHKKHILPLKRIFYHNIYHLYENTNKGEIMSEKDLLFIRRAIELSLENVRRGRGPFGAVITKDGKIISESCNQVTLINDPTAHAEIGAIREAARKLNTFNLSGCSIYVSCEPCPMCLGAIYWARIDKVFFANTRFDAEDIGFDDSIIYEEISRPMNERKIEFKQLLREEALEAFRAWEKSENKVEY